MDDIADDAFSMETETASTKFMSIILTNLQINYDGWKAELPPEEEEAKEEEKVEEKEEKGDGSSAEVCVCVCACACVRACVCARA